MAKKKSRAVTRRAAEDAVQTLLRWAGDDPHREGLRETPKRVVNAYRDWFSGYSSDPGAYLRRTFEEVEGYDEMVVLRDIAFESLWDITVLSDVNRLTYRSFANSASRSDIT